jgi:hypothetical protein
VVKLDARAGGNGESSKARGKVQGEVGVLGGFYRGRASVGEGIG